MLGREESSVCALRHIAALLLISPSTCEFFNLFGKSTLRKVIVIKYYHR